MRGYGYVGRTCTRRSLFLFILPIFIAIIEFRLVSAGPIALGGDDLTDHGSYTGSATAGGWHYIQKVLEKMLSPGVVTRPGNDGSIAALGCTLSTATSGDAGAAINFAATVALG